ncbi:MAG: inositol monophosphatase [Thermoplasmata archaeon]|nr:inositol monophosphatase [Thermoplasmata archaeon]
MRELEVLLDALRSARESLGGIGAVDPKPTVTGVFDVVTDADRRAEDIILGAIRSAFPDDPIISEESSPDAKGSERTWAVDPIDGSVNLSRGIPIYGMQGVFMECGRPSASAISLPCQDELYWASSDGAFMNGSPIRTADPRPLRECILTTGDFSRRSEEYRLMQARLMSDCRDCIARFKMLGAACVDFAYLASGRSDVHVRFVNKVWDFMPGMYLAEMAGAVYDRDLLDDTGILIMCSSREVLDEALSELLPRISPSSSRR